MNSNACKASHSVRPSYFDRQRLKAADLSMEQEYQNQRFRRQNRFLHGWGVVCGAEVGAVWEGEVPTSQIRLTEGYGLTPGGDELYFPPSLDAIDLKEQIKERCPQTGDCSNLTDLSEGGELEFEEVVEDCRVYLIARPCQEPCAADYPIPVDCQHPGGSPKASRIREGARLELVVELPSLHQPSEPDCDQLIRLVCGTETAQCPAAAEAADNYLVLATLWVRDCRILEIDNRYPRKRLLSPAVLQGYLQCYCEDLPQDPSPGSGSGSEPVPEPDESPTPVFVDPTLIEGLDERIYNVERGHLTAIEQLRILDPEQTTKLREAGIHSALDLYGADSQALADILDVPKARAAGYKMSILENLKRPQPLNLDASEFDIELGTSLAIEEAGNVGDTRGGRLREVGYTSVADLANANPQSVALAARVSDSQARSMIRNARSLIRRS